MRKMSKVSERFALNESSSFPSHSITSIFSESNPFRRNTVGQTQPFTDSKTIKQDSKPLLNVEIPSIGKRKYVDSGTRMNGDIGLQKETPNLDVQREGTNVNKRKGVDLVTGGEGSVNLGIKLSGLSKRERMNTPNLNIKKENSKVSKRKRDEVERQYEEKHCRVLKSGERVVGSEDEKKNKKTLENVAEVKVRKEGFDDESKLLRTVFVGNLPLKVKKKALLKEFLQFGEIESLRIRSVPIIDCKIPRKGAIMQKKFNEFVGSVNAYIVFKSEASAQLSLAHNMSVVEGNHIRVDRSCPPRKKMTGECSTTLYDNKRTVFVGNLPFDVKDEEIYQLFSGINNLGSSLEAVRVIRDPDISVGKGIAYVLFKTKESANMVVKKRNLKLRDRNLRLFHAKPERSRSKTIKPRPSQATSNFASKKASTSFEDGDLRNKSKAPLSYQGLRASKPGAQTRVKDRRNSAQLAFKSTVPKKKQKKNHSQKRPAIAAKKAKQLAMKAKFGGRIPEGKMGKK